MSRNFIYFHTTVCRPPDKASVSDDGLGREYKLDGIDLIPNEYMQELLEVAKKSGLKCQIGG